MPRIRVEFVNDKRTILSDGVNPPAEVVTTRLQVRVSLGGDAIRRPALIDTGAPLTMVSKTVWTRPPVLGRIDWLLFSPGAATLALPELTVAGRRYPYRLGRVPVELFDAAGTSLPATPVTAQFLEDDPQPGRPPLRPEVVVGLTGGALDARYLVVKPDPARREAWVTDDRPVPALVLAKAVL